MADEITITGALAAAKSGNYVEAESAAYTIDMSGTHMAQGSQSAPTAGEALATGDVTYPGHVMVVNPSTNTYTVSVYVEAGCTNLVSALNPGDPPCIMIRCGAVPGVKATTAAQTIQFWAVSA